MRNGITDRGPVAPPRTSPAAGPTRRSSRRSRALAAVNIAYTHLSLSDISEASAPFFDSNYRAELLWADEHIPALSRRGASASE